MAQRQEVRFQFHDPNTPEAWQAMLKKLLVEKLLAQYIAETDPQIRPAGEAPV